MLSDLVGLIKPIGYRFYIVHKTLLRKKGVLHAKLYIVLESRDWKNSDHELT